MFKWMPLLALKEVCGGNRGTSEKASLPPTCPAKAARTHAVVVGVRTGAALGSSAEVRLSE